jgi:hypothetical protein
MHRGNRLVAIARPMRRRYTPKDILWTTEGAILGSLLLLNCVVLGTLSTTDVVAGKEAGVAGSFPWRMQKTVSTTRCKLLVWDLYEARLRLKPFRILRSTWGTWYGERAMEIDDTVVDVVDGGVD